MPILKVGCATRIFKTCLQNFSLEEETGVVARSHFIRACAFLMFFTLAAVKRMKQLAVPDGIMLLAVPTGFDQLHWNIHRVYGRARLPLLLSSWKVEGIFGNQTQNDSSDGSHPHHLHSGLDENVLDQNRGHGVQPVYVLRNVENPEPFRF